MIYFSSSLLYFCNFSLIFIYFCILLVLVGELKFDFKKINWIHLIFLSTISIFIYLILTYILFYLFPIVQLPCSGFTCDSPPGALNYCSCTLLFSDPLKDLSFLRKVIPIFVAFVFCFASLRPNFINSLFLFVYILLLYSIFYIFLPYFSFLFNW